MTGMIKRFAEINATNIIKPSLNRRINSTIKPTKASAKGNSFKMEIGEP
ncbi:unnamed protein product [marine sediment metagenome]|uniref:Uncharacterized protein n=1 Tax=marine sediment metagenome TaxID=412755 RepID=X0RQY9_9ZZZZ